MNHSELISLFVALAVVLGTARLLGELARKLNQPAVMGELFAGIALGPTLLGAIAPGVFDFIFPSTAGFTIAIQGLTVVAIALFMLVAGIEVDLSSIFRQGKLAFGVAVGGIVVPFAVGFAAGWLGPLAVSPAAFGVGANGSAMVFALFLATTLSISALPVIAKTLMDLNLYRSELGMTVIAAAVLNDLIGWIIFAVLLGMMATEPGTGSSLPIGLTIGLTLAYVALMLTVGRAILHRSLPFVQAHTSWPGGVLGFAVVIAMLGAAFTEWIGIHAIFGSFIVGVALGDSSHLKERTRQTLEGFVTFIFAPLFFATVGLKIDFLANFNGALVLFVIAIACVGKLLGCGLAARLNGMPWRESWAIGAAMNARGAMEIILALLALEANLIDQQLFVALVVMALATSVVAGPIMQWILRRKKPHRFTDFLGTKSFVSKLEVADRFEAMQTLCEVSGASGLVMSKIVRSALTRERLLPTGIGQGIALSHLRLPNLDKPQVAMGLSSQGIDFDSPDGQPCHTICLILTSKNDEGLGLELYRDAAATFLDKPLLKKLSRVQNYTEFLALLAEYRGHTAAEALHGKPIAERNDLLIIGATATARALAKLFAATRGVQLVDNNAAHVAQARAEGLNAVYGNALDIEVLREAGAGSARSGWMMTANDQINAMVARKLHDFFQVPELAAVKQSDDAPANGERLRPLEMPIAFGSAISLSHWDHWWAANLVTIERIEIVDLEQVTSLLFDQQLIIAIESGNDTMTISPYTSATKCNVGDKLIMARLNRSSSRYT